MREIKMRCAISDHDGYPCLMKQTVSARQQRPGEEVTLVLTCVYGHNTYFPIGKIGATSKLQEWINQGEVL
jgi:hypothetical protein